ncbi:MAG: class I SAM-dependent rRNA methyltransferase [Bacteroidales bacterium]|nr:class I SAM-dependent rRNA methyltransferase [Bacteroidales bacterium]
MRELPCIVLKSGKDQSARRRHPWIFSGAIKKIYGNPATGDVVEVYDNKDERLGAGHFQVGTIAVRMLVFGNERIDGNFWKRRIEQAWNHRKEEGVFQPDKTNAFRLVNAEGDLLPGLIVDYYNGCAVIQMHSAGMFKNLTLISEALNNLEGLAIDTLYNKSRNSLVNYPEISVVDGPLSGKRMHGEILENGNGFTVNWEKGQKTGFFLDQRENRLLLERYAAGRKVLNMFCYTGGFSVYALRGGAELVHSVDSSEHAIELTNSNVALNFPGSDKHSSFCTDAFGFLDDRDDQYDLIILDPPAFAKHQRVLNNALQGYKRLNQKAIGKIRKGGELFTFSCSQAVSKENFRKSVFAAAANTGRDARILYQLTQPSDHPVSLYHPEGEYLKGLVLKID